MLSYIYIIGENMDIEMSQWDKIFKELDNINKLNLDEIKNICREQKEYLENRILYAESYTEFKAIKSIKEWLFGNRNNEKR
jgi:hypothetical protein